MTGGAAASVGSGDISGQLTKEVFVTCLVAASGGVLFGYDIVITGMSCIFNFSFVEIMYELGK